MAWIRLDCALEFNRVFPYIVDDPFMSNELPIVPLLPVGCDRSYSGQQAVRGIFISYNHA